MGAGWIHLSSEQRWGRFAAGFARQKQATRPDKMQERPVHAKESAQTCWLPRAGSGLNQKDCIERHSLPRDGMEESWIAAE
jgi:hypothetical protein